MRSLYKKHTHSDATATREEAGSTATEYTETAGTCVTKSSNSSGLSMPYLLTKESWLPESQNLSCCAQCKRMDPLSDETTHPHGERRDGASRMHNSRWLLVRALVRVPYKYSFVCSSCIDLSAMAVKQSLGRVQQCRACLRTSHPERKPETCGLFHELRSSWYWVTFWCRVSSEVVATRERVQVEGERSFRRQ